MRMVLAAYSMTTAATHFSVKARDGKARSGVLTTKNGSIETPSVLIYTRRGGLLNLTSPDMLATVTPAVQGIQLNTMQFLENPDARVLREYGRGAHGFLCLEGFPILASNRDPTIYEYGMRPSTDKEVHVSIHSGGHMVSPERYMETVAALKPDLFVSLCDEVPADAKAKRVAASVKRTAAWLDACLQLHATYEQASPQREKGKQQQAGEAASDPQPTNGSSDNGNGVCGAALDDGPLSGSLLLAALAGGGVAAERARAAAAVSDKKGVGGYALCGLGTGEVPEHRPALISASLGALPPTALEGRPVFAAGLSSNLEEILAAVAEGVDLLDCAFVAQVTAGGYALTFPLRPSPSELAPARGDYAGSAAVATPAGATSAAAEPAARRPFATSIVSGSAYPDLGPDVSIGADDTKINLWSISYSLDKGPLLPGCGCFACRRQTRAYVHHLLTTHEMLADVLLEAHNTSHINAFCQAIREAIAEGRFEEYRQWFRTLRSAPLAARPSHVAAKRKAVSGPTSPASYGAEPAAAEDTAASIDMDLVVAGDGGVQGSRAQGEARERQRQHQHHAKWVRVELREGSQPVNVATAI